MIGRRLHGSRSPGVLPHAAPTVPRLALFCAIGPAEASAQGISFVKSHYVKHEYRVPMRDGVALFTSVYIPKDRSHAYPILLQRTPYGVAPYGEDQYEEDIGPSARIGEAGYIVVSQDVPRMYLSEGTFEDVRPIQAPRRDRKFTDETTDTFDTIEWLVKSIPNNNGRVGMWGIFVSGVLRGGGAGPGRIRRSGRSRRRRLWSIGSWETTPITMAHCS